MRLWKGVLAAGVLAFGLGCAGISESIVELSTGAEMEISEDGTVTLKNPDGTTSIVSTGEKAALPEKFPLPYPPGDLPLESVMITTDADGNVKGTQTLSWQVKDDDFGALEDYYDAWFKKADLEYDRTETNMMGIRSITLIARTPDHVEMVTLNSAAGQKTLTLVIEPNKAE